MHTIASLEEEQVFDIDREIDLRDIGELQPRHEARGIQRSVLERSQRIWSQWERVREVSRRLAR